MHDGECLCGKVEPVSGVAEKVVMQDTEEIGKGTMETGGNWIKIIVGF